jgi:pyruvate, water dikinase
LLGGRQFEPTEENPMIGWRGASRYYSEEFEEAFALECAAIKRAREEMGLTNVVVMIPFCRTPEEGKKVIEMMEKYGLRRGEHGLKVYMMCEIPSNVILADEFAPLFDGISIGSNDLTQLTLGLDRDSGYVAHLYDERSAAVKWMIAEAIRRYSAKGLPVGICGQAPSDFPDFAEFLIEEGIGSIALSPDRVLSTTLEIARVEEKLGK